MSSDISSHDSSVPTPAFSDFFSGPLTRVAIVRRLADVGLNLPEASAAVAAYLPVVINEAQLYISGQLPFRADGSMIIGRLGADVDRASGYEAARRCGLMILAQLDRALDGDFSRIAQIVKLGIFVNSTVDFTEQPQVGNGASELMELVFGTQGRHSRSAVGVTVLPLGAAVEVDAIVALKTVA